MTDIAANLVHELDETIHAVDCWSDMHEKWLSHEQSNFQRALFQCESTLEAFKRNESDIDAARIQNEKVKSFQEDEIDRRKRELESLVHLRKVLETEYENLKLEEEKVQFTFSEVASELRNKQQEYERTLNELTHGFRLYRHLGLEFQKANNDCMKFTFTQIDKSNPGRQYFFLLFVDANDQYQLIESFPNLDPILLHKYVNSLNHNNDIGKFVCRMRKAFQETVCV